MILFLWIVHVSTNANTGEVALQIAKSLFWILRTSRSACEACLGAKTILHHLHSHPSFPLLTTWTTIYAQSKIRFYTIYERMYVRANWHKILGKGYSVLLANCPAICSVIFVTSCHFCMGQNVLAIWMAPFLPIHLYLNGASLIPFISDFLLGSCY